MALLERRDLRGLSSCDWVWTLEDRRARATEVHRFNSSRGPGRAFGGADPVYITPDIYVYKMGDDYHILLNEDGLPKLRINHDVSRCTREGFERCEATRRITSTTKSGRRSG